MLYRRARLLIGTRASHLSMYELGLSVLGSRFLWLVRRNTSLLLMRLIFIPNEVFGSVPGCHRGPYYNVLPYAFTKPGTVHTDLHFRDWEGYNSYQKSPFSVDQVPDV